MLTFSREVLKRFTPCRPLKSDKRALKDIAHDMAVVHADLLLIHPFRDGNGRIARWLADLMALQAGLPIPDFGFLGRGSRSRRRTYLEGVKHGYLLDFDLLTSVFADAIRRALGERI